MVALLSALSFVLIGTSASASPIVIYNFDNAADRDAPTSALNVSSTDFLAGAGLLNVDFGTGAAYARGWTETSAANAETAGDYWHLTVTAAAGYQFDLSDISLDEYRENSTASPVKHGPLQFQFWAAGSLIGTAEATTTTSFANHSFSLVGTNNLTSVTVRILGWDGDTGTSSGWFVDNVVLNGTIEPVGTTALTTAPEPTSMILLGSGLAALAFRRYRSRRETA
jgi:hypothetical protein